MVTPTLSPTKQWIVVHYNNHMWHKVRHWFHRRPYNDSNNFGHKSTPEARELGELLRQYGWKVELEKYDGYKHIDIAIVECKVNIEVDGLQHGYSRKQALADLERTYYSFIKGYVTLRIPNVLVHDYEARKTTAEFINKFLQTDSV